MHRYTLQETTYFARFFEKFFYLHWATVIQVKVATFFIQIESAGVKKIVIKTVGSQRWFNEQHSVFDITVTLQQNICVSFQWIKIEWYNKSLLTYFQGG
jgi:hypothetical protein